MQRRQFLKASCTACILGSAGISMLLESCGATGGLASFKAKMTNQQIRVPLDKLPASGPLILRVPELPYELALTNTTDGYEALALQCTHFPNPLFPEGNGYHCTVHGSRFDAHGQVVNGPAARPLKRYPATVQQQEILISIT